MINRKIMLINNTMYVILGSYFKCCDEERYSSKFISESSSGGSEYKLL